MDEAASDLQTYSVKRSVRWVLGLVAVFLSVLFLFQVVIPWIGLPGSEFQRQGWAVPSRIILGQLYLVLGILAVRAASFRLTLGETSIRVASALGQQTFLLTDLCGFWTSHDTESGETLHLLIREERATIQLMMRYFDSEPALSAAIRKTFRELKPEEIPWGATFRNRSSFFACAAFLGLTLQVVFIIFMMKSF